MEIDKVNFPFAFSIVMSVYNVEEFINEAVDSLITQDIGFTENVQIVFVNDGSTDRSGEICEEYQKLYPENIIVIHKANGGLSSARNEGLKYVTGRYVNFFDPDDLLSSNTLSQVYNFFSKHDEEIDMVSIPMYLFGAQTGEHILNNKFKKGTRIINLKTEYSSIQLSSASAFFTNQVAKTMRFDMKIVTAEDAKEVLRILLNKFCYGVVNNVKYKYRKRTSSNLSLLQSVEIKKEWYIECLKRFSLWALDISKKHCGYIPNFVQFTIMYDLQWKLRHVKLPYGLLTNSEIQEYLKLLHVILKEIDDKFILEQKQLWIEHKIKAIKIKYQRELFCMPISSDILLYIGNTNVTKISDLKFNIDFINLSEKEVELEGYANIPQFLSDQIDIRVLINDELIQCKKIKRYNTIQVLGEVLFEQQGFYIKIPLNSSVSNYKINLCYVYSGKFIIKSKNTFRKFSQVGIEYSNSYYCKYGWIIQGNLDFITINKCSKMQKIFKEIKFLKEIWIKNRLGGRKAVVARLFYHLIKIFKKKQIWLISDRILMAGDNGEAFFKFLEERKFKTIERYFVISRKSSDYMRMKHQGKVVDNLSFKHKFLHLLCDYNISSQADKITQNPFSNCYVFYRDILFHSRFVFLQHGVTKDDISGWLNRYNKNFFGFVAAANPEYASIISGNYGYSPDNVWLTGFPRFDLLYHDEKKLITIMPTWRQYLAISANPTTGIWTLKPDFKKSKYFLFYNNLFSNRRLISAAQKYGYQIQVMMHPNLRPHIELFSENSFVRYFDMNAKYRDIYAQSNLVITDYSSACFDFAYLRKPIVYCQFDREEFFAGEHVYTKGYFDYERDGFGEVEYDLESTVDRIIEYMENGCQLKDKYRERIDKFFAFNDQNNCQRVYEKIIEMDRREKSNDTEAQKVPVSL